MIKQMSRVTVAVKALNVLLRHITKQVSRVTVAEFGHTVWSFGLFVLKDIWFSSLLNLNIPDDDISETYHAMS